MDLSNDYAFTVKMLGNKHCVPSDYMDKVFSVWERKYDSKVDYVRYEPDSHGKCHAHGIVTLPEGMYRGKLCLKGFHTHFAQLTNRIGWKKYCEKAQCDKEEEDDQYMSDVEDDKDSLISDVGSDSEHEEEYEEPNSICIKINFNYPLKIKKYKKRKLPPV